MFSSSEMQADNLVVTNWAAPGVALNTQSNSDKLQAEGDKAHVRAKRDDEITRKAGTKGVTSHEDPDQHWYNKYLTPVAVISGLYQTGVDVAHNGTKVIKEDLKQTGLNAYESTPLSVAYGLGAKGDVAAANAEIEEDVKDPSLVQDLKNLTHTVVTNTKEAANKGLSGIGTSIWDTYKGELEVLGLRLAEGGIIILVVLLGTLYVYKKVF